MKKIYSLISLTTKTQVVEESKILATSLVAFFVLFGLPLFAQTFNTVGVHDVQITSGTTLGVSAVGADGGNRTFTGIPGGSGGQVSAEFAVNSGDFIRIIIGSTAASATNDGGGGAGTAIINCGSSLANCDNDLGTLLAVAGGGGGAGVNSGQGLGATTTPGTGSGHTQAFCTIYSGLGSAGGSGYGSGSGGFSGNGGAGAGYTDGTAISEGGSNFIDASGSNAVNTAGTDGGGSSSNGSVTLSLATTNLISYETCAESVLPPVACENTNPSQYQDDVFGPEQYGQSIVADASCLGGTDFSSFSVFHTGNGTPNVNIEIFQGETVSGTPMYSEDGFVSTPGNTTGLTSEFVFGTGTNATGSLTYVDGETYTFLLTVTGSNHFIHQTDDVIAGKFYYSDGVNPGSFQANRDLITGVAASDPSPPACENTNPSKYQDDVFSPEQYGQSIVADASCLGGTDFSSFSVFHTGNGTPNVNIEIFQGETVSGTPMYSEDGFVSTPGNTTGLTSEFVFGTGTNATGSLTYVDGQTYTFLLTVTGSNHFIHQTDDVIAGKFYYSDGVNPGSFQANRDLITGVSAVTNVAPSITCPANISVNNDAGFCLANVTFAATATGTPTPTIAYSQNSGTDFPVGTTTVTATATNSEGSDQCMFDITVIDNEAPVITCPTDITTPATSGSGAVVTFDNATAMDNCTGSPTIVQTVGSASGSTFSIGTHTVTFSATDAANEVSTCDLTIMVEGTPPSINCPANISVNNDAGECVAEVTFAATETQGIPASTITYSQNSNTDFSVGTTTVTATATNSEGSDDCTFDIIVTDNENPTVACPANVTVNAAAASCDAVATYTAPTTGSDNCAIAGVGLQTGLGSGATFPLGVNNETYSVTDAAGNVGSCTFTVTVEDNTAPSISCPINQDVDFSASCDYALLDYTGMATGVADNCESNPTVTQMPAVGTVITTTQTITLTVSDGTNSDDCTFDVVPLDNTPPTLNCPSDISLNTALGSCNNLVVFGDPIITDNCPGGVTVDGLTFDTGIQIPYIPTFASYLGLVNQGVHVGTFTATDANGLEGTCSFTITIADNEFPVFTNCPAASIAEEADFDDCAADVQWAAIFANDNCSYILTSTHTSGDNFPVGTTQVTYTATDESGNATDCIFDVIVEDATPPIAECKDITVVLDANGEYALTGQELDDGSSDNCTDVMMLVFTPSLSSITCANTFAAQTITLTVADATGNTANCTSQVTVEDNLNPTAVCQAYTVVLDGSGNGAVTMSDIDGGSNDNCGFSLAITNGQTTFDCSDAGSDVMVELTITDDSNNTDACMATVSIVDTQAPTISCPADISMGTDAAICGAVVTWVAPVTNDNCPNVTLNSDANSGDTFPIGTTDVNYTVTDASGNTETCSFSVTISDDDAPNALCQDVTVALDANGDASILPADIDNGSSDNCGITTISVIPAAFTCANLGANTVTLTVGDAAGNNSNCTAIVTVEDNIAPTFTGCPADITQPNDAGDCDAVVTWTPPVEDDNCSTTVMSSHNSGDTFPVGTTDVNYTVTDAAGNQATCSFSVTVEDTEAPTISCPTNITIGTDVGVCGAVITYTEPEGTDNCTGATTALTAGLASGTEFPVGTTDVTYTVADAVNLTASCTFTVIVNDDENPVIAGCPMNISQSNDNGSCDAVVMWTAPTASDNCSATLTDDAPAGNIFSVGTTTITYTATDPADNTAICSFDVTVTDDENPSITCPADIVQGTDAGVCGATVTYVAPIGNDNCPGQTTTMVEGQASGTVFPVGSTDVTYSVTDAAGNAVSCTFSVTINDTEVPVINNCPQDMTVSNDGGQCDAVVSWTEPTVSDNCAGATLGVASQASGSTFPVGSTTVTYDATDAAGNDAVQCSFVITVEDTEDPTIACPGDVVVSNDNGVCDAVVTWTEPTSGDNCPNATVASNFDSGATFPVGTTDVSYTITDAAGNEASCTFSVTVNDTELPNALCQDVTATLDANGNASIMAGQVNNNSTDNCGINALSVSPSAFTCNELGANTVTLTVNDINGNSNTCTATVTVTDIQDPIFNNCPGDIAQGNDTGSCGAAVTWTPPTVTDNCSTTIGSTHNPGDVFPVGSTNVDYTVMDAAGNMATCSFSVTISDTEVPNAICQPVTVQLDAMGNGSTTAAAVNNGSMDNCTDEANLTLALNDVDFTCADVAAGVTVTLTVTDEVNNFNTCTALVTVEDNVAPNAQCQDVTIQLDAMGDASTTAAAVDNNSTDACGVATLALSQEDFDCSELGANTVTLTVTDVNGNEETCTATVTVEDNIAPALTDCPNDMMVPALGTACAGLGSWDAPSVTDNCGLVLTNFDSEGQTVNPTDGSGSPSGIFPGGTTTITYTYTDGSGNQSVCTFDITVEDITDPTISACPANQTVSNDVGDCAADVIWQQPIMDDNCSGWTYQASHIPGSNFPVGSTDVGYTVTDAAGNTATCNFSVTVEDNEAPVINNCPTAPIAPVSSGTCMYEVPDLNTILTVTDNCTSPISGTQTPTAGTAVSAPTTVTFDVMDAAGNPAQCVVSLDLPAMLNASTTTTEASCPSSADGSATVTITGGVEPYTIAWSNGATTELNDGIAPATYEVTVTDASGCEAIVSAIVEGFDTENPDAECKTIIIQLDNDGLATIVAADVDDNSTDDCSIASLSVTPSTFGCDEIGTNFATLTVTDGTGNSDDCQATVIVENPLAGTPDFCGETYVLSLDENGVALFTSSEIGTVTDNCGDVLVFVNGEAFDCTDIGTSTEVSVTYINSNGQNNCDVTVEVIDELAPVANCKDFLLTLDENGNATATSTMANDNSEDNCGIQSITISQTDFDCSDIGNSPIEITMTVTDNFNQQSTCTANVTVVDNILTRPDFCDLPQTIYIGSDGEATFDPMANGPIADNCGTLEAIAVNATFDCTAIGDPTTEALVFYYNDAGIESCSVEIVVLDNSAPVAKCKDTTLALDESGNAVVLPSYIDDESFDNCSINTYEVSVTAFDCSDIGPQTVTLTVTDDQDFQSSCDAMITVIDNILPPTDLICEQTFNVDLEATGTVTFDITTLPVIMDNCGSTLTVFPVGNLDFNCNHLDDNQTVLLYLFDGNTVIDCNMFVQVNDPLDACGTSSQPIVTNPANGGVNPESAEDVFTAYDSSETINSLKENDVLLKLKQVRSYPNPFRDRVAIEFNLTTSAMVKMTAWDAKGRQVDALLNNVVSSGSHRFFWTPKSLSSGLYFIRIEVENEAPKMIRVQFIR